MKSETMKLFRKKWRKATQGPEQHDDWVQFITENGIERWAYIADL